MSIVSVLGESAVRSLALALAVWVVLRLLRVQHARIAKRAWTAVLILALAMPALVALHIPSVSFTALWSTPRTIIVTAPPAIPPADAMTREAADSSAVTRVQVQSENLAPAVTLTIPVPAALRSASAPVRHIAWWQIGFAAYLAITALLLFRVLLGLALAARLWRRAQSFATAQTDIPVRLSVELRSPATVGHGILLPLEAIEWDDAALSATLAHEEKHVREGDFYLQLAATLHHCFFWISPHAWWLRPQLARLSETICDRAAVTSSGDGLSYAQLLIRFATAEQTPAGMVAMAQSAGLRERVERLIADPDLAGAFHHRRGQAIAAGVLLAAAALVAAASVHIVQPQTVVLAAPQAPVAPPAMPSAPSDAPPLPPLPAPDAVLAPSHDIGIGEDSGTIQSPDTIVRVEPRVRVRTNDLPTRIDTRVIQMHGIETRVIAAPHLDVMPRVVAVGPMAMIGPPVTVDTHVKILAIPHVAALQTDDEDFIELDGRNYAVCGPNNDGAEHNCSLNGYNLKDRKSGAILFERDGKTYIIDDPALVKQAQEAYARVRELGKQQGELGGRQGELGAQQGELGAIQGELGAKQGEWGAMQGKFAEDFHFEMPKDFDKTVQALTDSETKLDLEHDKLSEAQRAELETQRKEARANFDKAMAEIRAQQPQREAMEKQMREQAEQIRKQMEPLEKQMRELGEKQGDLGRLQGELGHQQAL
ncbi:MAG TPA: M56 family metallopeptidase, partial [Acidobacteriaceae bacterium]|nr:M56 family metallopeptidase [Acidobacteriaceae bacterium]